MNDITQSATIDNIESHVVRDDAPPKYTPPPSYTTATGAYLAKILRQSVRRSVRRYYTHNIFLCQTVMVFINFRILGETSSRTRPTIQTTASMINDGRLPPEYSAVLSNPSGNIQNNEMGPRVLYNTYTLRTLSLGRSSDQRQIPSEVNEASASYTANDVTNILRSSLRRPSHQRSISMIGTKMENIKNSASFKNKHCQSVENLVLNAAPLGESSIISLGNLSSTRCNRRNSWNENTSVI